MDGERKVGVVKRTKKSRRGRGRPKGSTKAGPRVHVGFRIPKELAEEIFALRDRIVDGEKTRTHAFENVLRAGLDQIKQGQKG